MEFESPPLDLGERLAELQKMKADTERELVRLESELTATRRTLESIEAEESLLRKGTLDAND